MFATYTITILIVLPLALVHCEPVSSYNHSLLPQPVGCVQRSSLEICDIQLLLTSPQLVRCTGHRRTIHECHHQPQIHHQLFECSHHTTRKILVRVVVHVHM